MASLRTFEDVLDVVHDEISIQIGFCEMMRLAQTSKSLMSSVCSRAMEINFAPSLDRDESPRYPYVCPIPLERVVPLVRQCAGLRRVRLSANFCEDERAPDEVILALTGYCESLRSLECYDGFECLGVSDSAIATVARVHTDIAELALGWQERLTDDALRSIAQHLPKLKVLKIDGSTSFTDAGVIELVQSCTSLKTIHLCDLRCIDTEDVNLVIFAIAKNCRRLEDLQLFPDRSIGDYIYPVDTKLDEAFAALASSCPLLRALELQRSPISDVALIALADCPIRDLCLCSCPNVTDASVTAFLPTWRILPNVVVHVEYTAMTAASILAIAAQVPNLISLSFFSIIASIYGCAYVTDAHLDALARGCPNLMKFEFDFYHSEMETRFKPTYHRPEVVARSWDSEEEDYVPVYRVFLTSEAAVVAFQRALPHFGDHRKLRKILDSYELKY